MSMSSRLLRSPGSALVVVLALALVIRVAYLCLYSAMPDWDQLTVDNYYHHNWAQMMAGGDAAGDTTYFRAPFYIYCLAMLYVLFGNSLWVARVFGLAIGLASIAATYFLGRRVVSARVGLLAALIQAVLPMVLYFESELLLDPLFMLLLQVAVLFWLRWRDSLRPKDMLAAGLLLGLAAITRPTGLAVMVLLAIVTALSGVSLKIRLRHGLIMLTAVALVVGPVFVRNLVVAGDPVLISSQGGINFYLGNNDVANGISSRMPEPYGYNWRLSDVTYLAEQDAGRALKPGEVSEYWLERGIDWIMNHPTQAIQLYLQKVYRFLSNDEVSNNRNLGLFANRMPLLAYNPFSFAIVFAFGVIGLILLARKNDSLLLLAGIIVVYILVGSLFFFASRFRLPLLPYLAILAAAGALELTSRLANRSPRTPIIIGGLVLVWMFSYLPVLSLPPGISSTGHISKGLYYYRTGDFAQARDLFAEARTIDSTFPEVNLNLGVSYLRLGMIDSADHYLRQEQHFNPARPKTYVNRASLKLLAGDLDSAETLVTLAVGMAPNDVTARRLQIRVASQSGIDKDSLYDLAGQAAVATHDDPELVNEAAIQLSTEGGEEMARKLLLGALQSSPPPIERDDRLFEPKYPAVIEERNRQLARSHYQLGYLAGLSGDLKAAVFHSRKSISIDPTRVAAYVNLVTGLVLLGDSRQADSVLHEALQRFPDDPLVRALRSAVRK